MQSHTKGVAMSKSKTILRLSLTDIRRIHTTIIENHAILNNDHLSYSEQLNKLQQLLVVLFLDVSDRIRRQRGISDLDKAYLKLAIPEVKKIFYAMEHQSNELEKLSNPLSKEEVIFTSNQETSKKLENSGHRVILKVGRENKIKIRHIEVENYSAKLLRVENDRNSLPSPEAIFTRSEVLATKLRRLGHPVVLSEKVSG